MHAWAGSPRSRWPCTTGSGDAHHEGDPARGPRRPGGSATGGASSAAAAGGRSARQGDGHRRRRPRRADPQRHLQVDAAHAGDSRQRDGRRGRCGRIRRHGPTGRPARVRECAGTERSAAAATPKPSACPRPRRSFSPMRSASTMPSVLETSSSRWPCCRAMATSPATSILIPGAAGGVATALVQVARDRGLHVIGTASTPQKKDFALANGAHEVVEAILRD